MKNLITSMMLCLLTANAYAAAENYCTKFNPAQNKAFTDTFGLNSMVVSRANTKVSGTFTHNFGNGKISTATFSGICTGNQMSFNWSQGDYRGQFSATLVCTNNTYNLVNIIANINNVSVYIAAMYSPPGTCP